MDTFVDTDADLAPDCIDTDDDDDLSLDGADCAPLDPAVNPATKETCNGVDDDCSGTIDDAYADDAQTWYEDVDADGFGDSAVLVVACAAPVGYVPGSGDCDDDAKAVNPGGLETCAAGDEDCDGGADDADPTGTPADALAWYADADGDTFGDPADEVIACAEPAGYVAPANGTDCDDDDPDANPSLPEICNNTVDDNCDGAVDTDGDDRDWWPDVDGDGHGDSSATPTNDCAPPAAGWVSVGDDCDDGEAAVNPEQDEVPGNGVDDDCDATTADELDTGEDTDPPDTDDPGDTDDRPFETDIPLDTATEDTRGGGCKCGHGPGLAPTALLLLPLFALRRRRRAA